MHASMTAHAKQFTLRHTHTEVVTCHIYHSRESAAAAAAAAAESFFVWSHVTRRSLALRSTVGGFSGENVF